MAVLGIDLGVRSFHAAILYESGHLELASYVPRMVGRVMDQDDQVRGHELNILAGTLQGLVNHGDIVHVEEPPLAGPKNIRVYLKLAQASAALAVGAIQGGAQVSFVPVDTWKKDTCGRGGASKKLVAAWLKQQFPEYFRSCAGVQDFIDATAIAIRAAGARGVGDIRTLAAS